MTDYTSYHLPGRVITLRTGGRVVRGEPVMPSGSGRVERWAPGGEYLGIAARSAPTDDLVPVYPGGAVQSGLADGPLTAGDLVEISGTTGRQVRLASGTGHADGVALTTAADGAMVFWMQRPVGPEPAAPPPPPLVTALLPSTGPAAGGTPLTVAGNNLGGVTACTIGGAPVTNLTPIGPGGFSCTTPPGTAGPADVIATTPSGSSTPGPGSVFTYTAPPNPTNIIPNSGPEGGGTAVTILGTQLTGATAVTIGGAPLANLGGGAAITGETPPGAQGPADVVVTSPAGSGTLPGGFTYTPNPGQAGVTIDSVTPPTGPAGGGMGVAIVGSGFTGADPATGVTFGGTPATLVTVDDDTSIHCAIPAGPPGQAVDVEVTSPSGTGILTGGFTYQLPASPAAVTPDRGPDAGGASVTITGTGFTGSGNVLFGASVAVNRVIVDDTTITCDTPAHAAGTVTVTVAKTGGNGILPNGYTYEPPPALTTVDPDTGSAQGDEPVSLIGSDFTSPIAVRFGAADSAQTAVISPTQAACTTAPGTQGDTVDVTVTCAGGSATLPGGFTYTTAERDPERVPLADFLDRVRPEQEPAPRAKPAKPRAARKPRGKAT
jgi:IPT/TIG domain